jgi:hypothetical protein
VVCYKADLCSGWFATKKASAVPYTLMCARTMDAVLFNYKKCSCGYADHALLQKVCR